MTQQTTSSDSRPRKRNYPRAPLSIRVRYEVPNDPGKEGFTGTIGGGGIFIETLHPLPEGSDITLDFLLPGKSGQVRVEGLVVWSRPEDDSKGLQPGMGVQFKRVEESDREKILELVMRILMGKPEDDAL